MTAVKLSEEEAVANIFERHALELQGRLADEGIDLFLITDPDSVYYVSGYWGYLGVDWGRPTVIAVPKDGELILITPKLESEMAAAMTWIEDIRIFVDGVAGEWVDPLRDLVTRDGTDRIAVERFQIPAIVSEFLREELGPGQLADGSGILGEMRMIKSLEEIEILRQAGQLAVAMCAAGKATIAEGIPEYEVALAVAEAGTRKAAELMGNEKGDLFQSPMIHDLQSLKCGVHTSMAHRRTSVQRIQRGDPIHMCLCGIAKFKQFKPGMDRQYVVGEPSDELHKAYEITLAAQQAAINAIRPGVPAEDIALATHEVYRQVGASSASRAGRGIGYSVNELPQLKVGDKTPLRPGMVLAVDGGVSRPGEFGSWTCDTFLVTETGTECLTEFSQAL